MSRVLITSVVLWMTCVFINADFLQRIFWPYITLRSKFLQDEIKKSPPVWRVGGFFECSLFLCFFLFSPFLFVALKHREQFFVQYHGFRVGSRFFFVHVRPVISYNHCLLFNLSRVRGYLLGPQEFR